MRSGMTMQVVAELVVVVIVVVHDGVPDSGMSLALNLRWLKIEDSLVRRFEIRMSSFTVVC